MRWVVVYNFQQGSNYQDTDVETCIYIGDIGKNREDTIKKFHQDIEFADPRIYLGYGDSVDYTVQFVMYTAVDHISNFGLGENGDSDIDWYTKERAKYADPEYQQYLKLKEKFEQ